MTVAEEESSKSGRERKAHRDAELDSSFEMLALFGF